MSAGGITTRLLAFANAILGRFKGGLAMSNVLSATFFAGISGSAVADTSALGRILIPAMIQEGYKPGFTAAVTASANVLAPIIPPSIAFIVVGVLTDQSITRLFIAGILIGVMYSAAMLLVIVWLARTHDFPVHGKTPPSEIWRTFVNALAAIVMPVFIVGGIRTGVFNVTECSAVAVLYALFVGGVVYRELTLRKILDALISSAHLTAIIMIIVGAARIFSWILGYTGLPDQIAALLLSMTDNPLMFLLLINVLLLVVGMFVEANAALIMLLPVLYPVAITLGIEPLHFSVVVVVNLCIGLITPPVGLCLNLTTLMAGIKLEEGVRAIWPFLGAGLLILALLTYIPGLATWLPNLLMN
jgi:C4-dicarboxylate transporter DctM subunit